MPIATVEGAAWDRLVNEARKSIQEFRYSTKHISDTQVCIGFGISEAMTNVYGVEALVREEPATAQQNRDLDDDKKPKMTSPDQDERPRESGVREPISSEDDIPEVLGQTSKPARRPFAVKTGAGSLVSLAQAMLSNPTMEEGLKAGLAGRIVDFSVSDTAECLGIEGSEEEMLSMGIQLQGEKTDSESTDGSNSEKSEDE